ncbi:MAG: Ig-like domain-containing protein, partial [Saprospiraceae bacterium]|nr:Ig-like domain-containing protein [Saprospiraceae bacterium]
TGPNGFASTDQNPIIPNATQVDAGLYSCQIQVNGCTSDPVSTNVEIDSNPIIEITGSSTICQLEITTMTPNSGGTWSLYWSTNNENEATVNNSGVVTGVLPGQAIFQFTTTSGCTALSDTITVIEIPVTDLTGPDQICIGETTTIEPNTGGTWDSTDPTIATIDNFGNITGVGAGVTVFYYTSASTLCTSQESDPVFVNIPTPVFAPKDRLCIGETMTLSPNSGGTWVSSNTSVATVNAFTGLATGIAQGSVIFTFTDASTGCSNNSIPVIVDPNPAVAFTGPDTVCVGSTTSIAPTTGGTWVSDNTAVATIDNLGNVTVISPGMAFLTYTNTTTGCTSEALKLTVIEASQTSIEDAILCVGETTQVNSNSQGTWTSNDESVATVSPTGEVQAVGAGITQIVFNPDAACPDIDPLIVTVNGPETVVLEDTQICIGGTTKATTTAIGTWITSDPSVATIDANSGVITGVSAGTVTVQFTNTVTTCISNESEILTVHPIPETILEGPGEICAGETTQFLPNSGGTWTSDNPAIAIIDNSGLVSAISPGGPVGFTWTSNSTGCASDASETIIVKTCQMPGISCEDIEADNVYCDFDLLGSIQGSLFDGPTLGTQPEEALCEGGDEAYNSIWYGFVALEGDYEMVVHTFSCSTENNIRGAQVGVYSSCDFSEENKVYCDVSMNEENEFLISSDLFEKGNVYYLFIDGVNQSLCDYTIAINGFYDNTYCTELSKVTGTAYIDENENGLYDSNETPLRNVLISLSPGNFSVLTNDEGKYIINTPKGGTTLTAQINEGEWVEHILTIEDLSVFDDCVEGIDFGFIADPTTIYSATLSVANTIVRCDWETKFYITIENTGSEPFIGALEFEFDDKAEFFSSPIQNSTVVGNIVSATTDVLLPFIPQTYEITLKMPSGSSNLPILDFKASLKDQLELDVAEYNYSEQLRCSYDPNDKRTYPDREGDENLTLMDEDIEYTIRFQNNGNDTAFTVKIVDELDSNIDPTSIRVIHSSHEVETCIEGTQLIFLFENIDLVDSTTNYEASQGFVTFRSNTKDGRAENTPVNNTADIIFDSNAPIVTNTTLNTLVSELCSNSITEIDIDICEGEMYNGNEVSGTYTEIFPLQYGCDSIVVINLNVQGITYSNQEVEVCQGETVVLNGIPYSLNESQEVLDTIINELGCISNVLTFDVKVHPILELTIDTTICEGMSYEGLTESGTYVQEGADPITGCKIITIVNLEVLPISDPSCLVNTTEVVETDIHLYPNPAQDYITIQSNIPIDRIEIYSVEYQKITSKTYANPSAQTQISVMDLNPGLYIVSIQSNGKNSYKKLIIK